MHVCTHANADLRRGMQVRHPIRRCERLLCLLLLLLMTVIDLPTVKLSILTAAATTELEA